jgi:hypothetical protein
VLFVSFRCRLEARLPAGCRPQEYFLGLRGFRVGAVMRITFFTEQAAEAAVKTWERHGFAAARSGTAVITDCPTLWAVPIIHRAIGFHQVERLDVISPHSPTSTPNAGEQRGSSSDGFS